MVDKTELNYHCKQCDNKFSRMIGTTTGGGKHQTTTDQVPCHNCSNVLKTFKE